MDFSLTEEQQLVRESALRFVTDHGRREPGATGFDRALWDEMSAMGWIAAGVPEDRGGYGGPIETTLIAEELGRGLIGGDFLGAGVLGPQLLLAAAGPREERLLEEVVTGSRIVAAAFSESGARGDLGYAQTRASATDAGYAVSGEKTLVLGGDAADLLVVSARTEDGEVGSAGLSLFLVDPKSAGVVTIPTSLVDGSSAATIRFQGARGELLGDLGTGLGGLMIMAEHAIACIAAETVGMIEAIAEMTAEYFRGRKQFGRTLGEFQVLQHKLADMTIDAEMARATLLVSLAAFELETGTLRERRFSGVKAASGEALRRVAGSGVQAHGGMGMTIEYPVGRYLQRTVVLDAILGSPAHHLGVCARSLAV